MFSFLKIITESLPSKYDYLKEQVTNDFLIGKERNSLGGKNCYTLTLNAKLESEFSSRSLHSFFILNGIKIINHKKQIEEVELHIIEGMLAGYETESKIEFLDLNTIDCSEVKEKTFENKDLDALIAILGSTSNEIFSLLELKNTFKIEIDEGLFYVLKDLGNGNYLSLSQSGSVYRLVHDPYKVEKKSTAKRVF